MKKKQQQKEENKSTNDVMQVINVNENLTFNGKGKQVKFNLDQSSVRDHDIDTHRDDNSVAQLAFDPSIQPSRDLEQFINYASANKLDDKVSVVELYNRYQTQGAGAGKKGSDSPQSIA